MRSVKLAGNLLGLDSQINGLVQLKPAETFSAAKANDSAKAITDYLGELGYAFANVNPNPQLDRDKHEADVTFYVDPSRRVYVRRIQIGGNTRTRDEVVRREMRQQEAAWYDAKDIKTRATASTVWATSAKSMSRPTLCRARPTRSTSTST